LNLRLDDPFVARRASADWLSLALMDARNHTLAWLAAFEASSHGPLAPAAGLPGALWLAGHAAWWGEYWILRNVQAQRGERCESGGPRLASIEPRADEAFAPEQRAAAAHRPPSWSESDGVRAYLTDTMEAMLDLLPTMPDSDEGLHFHRLALWREDRTAEALATLAQAAGVSEGPWPTLPSRPDRPPLWLPAQRFALGSAPGGLVPEAERWAHELALPEFEIDAQAVSWARLVEFAEDGGYDEPRWWDPPAWDWVQASQRRAPRYVEQLGQGVVRQAQGRLQRAAPGQAAAHVTRHEAQAWCRWAGRRLPTEPEWELAACTAGSRGFVWGDVLEWVGGSGRAWPGHAPVTGDPDPVVAGAGVLRGAGYTTPARAAHPKARRFAAPTDDLAVCGFRSCAL
jgi:formylglycine-generating enzyme required for sulfatase activity